MNALFQSVVMRLWHAGALGLSDDDIADLSILIEESALMARKLSRSMEGVACLIANDPGELDASTAAALFMTFSHAADGVAALAELSNAANIESGERRRLREGVRNA